MGEAVAMTNLQVRLRMAMDAVGVLQVVRLVEYTQAEQVLKPASITASGVKLR